MENNDNDKNKEEIVPQVNGNKETRKPGGIVVWGQKTLQTKPSATDRINVRRLLIAIEKAIAETNVVSMIGLL